MSYDTPTIISSTVNVSIGESGACILATHAVDALDELDLVSESINKPPSCLFSSSVDVG